MITSAPTSIAAFLGTASDGPLDRAVPVSSGADFARAFGGLDGSRLLGDAVAQFFLNGGAHAYIVRMRDRVDGARGQVDGAAAAEAALLLDATDGFNLLCVPGLSDGAALARLQAFCRERRAFLIADCAAGDSVATLQSGPPRALTGDSAMNSAFYFPWITVADPLDATRQRQVPPCGFVAGIFARTDASRGVWKSPAGLEAALKGASGVTVALSEADLWVLNPTGINGIRMLPERGIVIWGARTLHGADGRASEWKYVPIRRTALFIEQSLSRGLQWIVSEPNGELLWARIRLEVETFMAGLFRQGAFQGRTPRDAYFVKCDRETTTQHDITLGFVNIVVGFAPLKPAEFVVITLRQLARPAGDDDPAI